MGIPLRIDGIRVRAVFFGLITLIACPLHAAGRLEALAQSVGVRILSEGTSDRSVSRSSAAELPLSRMSADNQQRTRQIISNTSQYRRMPELQYEVAPAVYRYLVQHPDVAVSTWRAMGISQLKMLQTGPAEYEATAADGSEGIADVLLQDNNQCLFVVSGKYSSPLLPTAIHASALVWLRYRFRERNDGSVVVQQQVETFIHFPSTAVEVIAKLAARVTNSILDRNAFEVSLYARMMSEAARKDITWIEHLADRLDGVLPRRKQELVHFCSQYCQAPGSVVLSGRPESPRAGHAALRDFATSVQQINQFIPISSGNGSPPLPQPSASVAGEQPEQDVNSQEAPRLLFSSSLPSSADARKDDDGSTPFKNAPLSSGGPLMNIE